jgi:hypothetical protein
VVVLRWNIAEYDISSPVEEFDSISSSGRYSGLGADDLYVIDSIKPCCLNISCRRHSNQRVDPAISVIIYIHLESNYSGW